LGGASDALEVALGKAFQGNTGEQLGRLLHEAGMIMGECMTSNISPRQAPLLKGKEDFTGWLCHTKSPKHHSWKRFGTSWVTPELEADIVATHRLIELIKPNCIIALGELALFALTGKTSTKKWRGSQLRLQGSSHSCTVIPTYHPKYITRDHSVRATTVQDLRRARRVSGTPEDQKPKVKEFIRPSFTEAYNYLKALKARVEKGVTPISVDIETRAGHIACIGFATSKTEAFCIPLMCVERPFGYWSELEETMLVDLIREALSHPNAMCFGQNFIYDIQYIYRFWFFIPTTWYDTMNAQHILFPGTPKSLDYLASLYCEYYVYWKEDHKTPTSKVGE
jgi:uracil-DNA glycosylase